jgi:DNA-binding MltR family transcriptional regulator
MTWAILEDLKEAHTRAIVEILTGSERALAIVGGALLDESVQRTLSERFRNEKEIVDGLFKPSRPLGNLNPKIDVLYLVGGIDKPTWRALKGITGVRNFFAHDLRASFEVTDKKLLKAMEHLTLNDGRTHYPHHLYGGDSEVPIERVKNNRDQFLVNLKLCLIMLMRDRTSHHAHASTLLTEKELEEKYGAK